MGCGSRLAQAAHGCVGAAKAILHLDRAEDATVAARRATCRACEDAVPCVKQTGRFCRCRKCGCVLAWKTSLRSETCPLGKW